MNPKFVNTPTLASMKRSPVSLKSWQHTKIVRQNFEIFLEEAIDQHRTAELSDHASTQTLLQQLRTP
jgi:hypothetical protein